jgi:hypothetical protein
MSAAGGASSVSPPGVFATVSRSPELLLCPSGDDVVALSALAGSDLSCAP